MTDLATGNMALLALAPNGIAQLRSLIMDLAVRGRLIAQQEDDAPAVEAIACIDRAKRARLTKAELARLDALATAPIDEQPFDLPASWLWRRLGAIGVVASSSRVHQKDWTTEGIPFYRTREIVQLSHRGSVTPDLFISEALFDELVARSPGPAAGDIMITGVGTIGVPYVVRASDKFYFKDASVLIFKNHFGFSPDYLALFFKSPWWRETIHKESMGTTVHTLTIGRANEVLVPIPPLAEQHRIVAKVDELMALCDRLEARQQDAEAAHARLVQALLESLTQARDAEEFQACWQRVEESFSTLFTTDGAIASLRRAILRCGVSGLLSQRLSSDRSAQDLLREVSASRGRLASAGRAWSLEDVPQASRTDLAFEIPEAWAVVRAAEVCWPITSGSTPPASEMHESLGIPFLKVYNIRNQVIDFGYKPQFVSESYHDSKLRRSCLQPGDIVMNIVGPPLGKVAVVPDDFPEWNCNQAIVGFRLIPPMVPAFLYLYLCEGAFLQGIELIGTAGQDNISVTKSKHLPIPVPPTEEQRRIVTKVTELLALCDQLKARIAAAHAKHAQLAEALVAQAVA